MREAACLCFLSLAVLIGAPVEAVADVVFTVTGATFTNASAWSIQNGSTANITSCTVDISSAPLLGGLVFGTAGGATGDPADDMDFMTADAGTVGLASPEADALNDGDVPDRSNKFTMTFNDFNPTETFVFGIDVDDISDDAGVAGSGLKGTTVTCVAGGRTLRGVLQTTDVALQSSATLTEVVTGVPAPTLSPAALMLVFLGLAAIGVTRLRGLESAPRLRVRWMARP